MQRDVCFETVASLLKADVEVSMSTITQKNVPPNVHMGIKRRAEKHHRSVNREIVYFLERTPGLAEDEVDEIRAIFEVAHKRIRQFSNQAKFQTLFI